jgi:hypothetical protein
VYAGIYRAIQVESLGGDIVGHCEENSPCEHVSNSELVTEIELFEYTNTKGFVNNNKGREITYW